MPPTTYEVRVSGLLPDDAVAEFGDVRVTTTDVSTVLSGELSRPAALLGLLARLRALGVDVVEVRRVLTPTAPADAETAAAGRAAALRRGRSRPSGMTPFRRPSARVMAWSGRNSPATQDVAERQRR